MLFEKKIVDYFRSRLLVRQDNPRGIVYFSHTDFPGLRAHSYAVHSSLGHTLAGSFYHYDHPIPGRLVVFDHGMGNGHRAYMREIERLAKAGYLVFSYDHTGCMASGGEHIRGFAQSLRDLDDCIRALKEEPALKDRALSVLGHSWGGFSAMNIGYLHPEITHIVAMSGFVSVELMLQQLLGRFLKVYAGSLWMLEWEMNPGYAEISALDSLRRTEAQVLLIHSEDDRTVKSKLHFDTLREGLSWKKNIHFVLLKGKDHNPTYAADAVVYKNGFFKAFAKAVKKKQLETADDQRAFMSRYDWMRMTQQDESVWKAIERFLSK